MADDGDCDCYAAVRMSVFDKPVVYFEEALIGNENLEMFEKVNISVSA